MPKRSTRVLRQHSQRPAKTLMSQTKRYSEFTLQMNSSRRRIYTIRWTKAFCPADGFSLADEHSSDLIIVHMEILSDITPRLTSVTKVCRSHSDQDQGLPEPSLSAHIATCRIWQEISTAILNLRHPTKQGLPRYWVLHPVFATFLHDVGSMCLTE